MKAITTKIMIAIGILLGFLISYTITGLEFLEQMLVITGAILLAFLLSLRFRGNGFLKKYAGTISLMITIIILSLGYAMTHNFVLIEIIVYLSALLLAWLTSLLFKGEEK